jgi:lipopolysaccharide export LptBFGC system permease protein LptF
MTAWAMAPAACIAMFVVVGTMASDGELVALLASGISPRRLWPAIAAWLCGLVAATSFVALFAGPMAGTSLRKLALSLCSRTLATAVPPGEVGSPLKGISLRYERMEQGVLQAVFLSDDRNPERTLRIAAHSGTLRVEPRQGLLSLDLESGTAFLVSEKIDLRAAISFEFLSLKLPVLEAIEERAGFVPPSLVLPTSRLLREPPPGISRGQWQYALWRRLASIAAVAVLGAISALLAFAAPRKRALGVLHATALFVSYHLSSRLFEELMKSDILSAIAAALLPLVVPGILAWMAFARHRKVYPQAMME